ncbi:uncharacterized GPI-anchored protein At3g06035 [Nicotiana tomentosiformis]|uniref:Uncharacterized GPI-anchored protein At3g06035-like n=1 Tax=Nicotiana tabacum TaxID=4097 RepID=A0A1S4DHN7_TOBAC|nr:uncharacterized GPI-anchored protein At3g06035 [Nicotiana tomentosiformis]XP_016512774.1 PREDICTED: uncharacterized GPI-anchored protein At3g06035-like [Nicotiana tabacum]
MASLRVPPAAFLFLFAPLLIWAPVNCDDEGHVLSGINSYRQSHNLPALTKHDKADCLADEIADEMQNQPCPRGGITPSPAPQFTQYPKLLDKCDIDINTTTDGIILPVCVHDRVATLVLTNYTQSQHVRFLNNSKYSGAGIGTEDDWTVLVLTTNTVGGSFASGATSLISHVFGWSLYNLLFSLLGMLLVNVY